MCVRKKSKILSIEQECEDNKMIDLKKKYIEIYLCVYTMELRMDEKKK